MSRDGWVALPPGAMGLSAVCDCGISWSYSLTVFPYTDSKSLTNVATCLKASEGIANDILQLTEIGKEKVKNCVESGKLNTLNL